MQPSEATSINRSQRRTVEQEILLELTGRTSQQQNVDGPDRYAQILKSYWHGLCFAPLAAGLDEIRFHNLVMRALPVCKSGWPKICKGEVRDTIASCEALRGLGDVQAASDHAIDFSLRMWLMLDCSELGTEGTPSLWPEDMPLEQFADACSWFGSIQTAPEDAQKTFPRKFSARQLDRITGIKVRWTDLLSEHLIFDEKAEQLIVFGSENWIVQMCGLENISNPGHAGLSANGPAISGSALPVCALPVGLLNEILRSLDLLFPVTDKVTAKWLDRDEIDFHSVTRPAQMRREARNSRRQPRLREFIYLKERLLDLIEEYQSPPKHWKNIWRDRRNPMAFWTFWIGLAIFLITISVGIVASILAGLTLGRTVVS